MSRVLEVLDHIAVNVGGDWKNNVLVDNEMDDALVDAYNEGVRAMASQVCFYVSAILAGESAKEKIQEARTL